jgi:hypothetical protein
MKAFVGIFLLAAAFVIVGCSDQTPVTGPVEPVSMAVSQQTLNVPVVSKPGDLPVNFSVFDPYEGGKVQVFGVITYEYTLESKNFVLTTNTDLILRPLNGDEEIFSFKSTVEHQSELDEKGLGGVSEQHLLKIPGHGTWRLVTVLVTDSSHPWIGSINLVLEPKERAALAID